jgi:hypothetical protein
MPGAYRNFLEGAHQFLEHVVRDNAISPEEVRKLRSLSDDVHRLAERSERDGWPEMITVWAHTRDSHDKEVDGYEVWFVAPGFVNYPSHFEKFGPLSTPSSRSLLPVDWVFWTQHPTRVGSRGEKKPISLWNVRTPDYDIHLPIPPQSP